MNDWNPQANEIFLRALELDSREAQKAYLDEACAGDRDLCAHVESLLEADRMAHSFLERPVGDVAVTIDPPSGIAERPGVQIGPYKLIQEIGEGGMGIVFMALQKEPVRRKVALKIIKPGMDTREVIARFEAEQQALAMMDHSNIAKVLDAGTTDTGRPYFVMEVVNGIPITEYCDSNHLPTRERLRLFILLCHAVQHAHQKGIIHRDLKPSNILVTLHDGVPVPKIIDFGIAKAINQDLTTRTLATGLGHMIGTPLYMSPEQAERSGLDIDTRSDIYSLGVLLYELLTGSTPFDQQQLRNAGLDEIRRLIREQEPPRPSTRISTLGQAATTVSERRSTNSVELSKSLRHELDWIVMKALEKDRTRRYETANDFARDIQRYLDDEPVEACPPSTAYRVKKFVRRNRTTVMAISAVGLALILGAGVAGGQAYRATKAERIAEEQLQIAQEQERLAKRQARLIEKQKKLAETAAARERELRAEAEQQRDLAQKATREAEAVTSFLVEAFRSPTPDRDGRTITVAEMLDQAALRVERDSAQDLVTRAKLLEAIGETYHSLGLPHQALPLIEKAHELLRESLGEDHPETLSRASSVAFCYQNVGRLEDSLRLFQQTLERQQAVLPTNHFDMLLTMHNMATTLESLGRRHEALELFEKTLELTKAHLGTDAPLTLTTMCNLADSYLEVGRVDQAAVLCEESLELTGASLGQDHTLALTLMNNLAAAYDRLQRPAEALALREKALERMTAKLGPNHPDTLITMNGLATALANAGRADEAVVVFEQILELAKARPGPPDLALLAIMQNLGALYCRMGKRDQALPLLEETLRLEKTMLAPDHPNVLRTMDSLGAAYGNAGRTDDAVRLLEQTVELSKGRFGLDAPETLRSMDNLAQGYLASSRLSESIALREQALALLKGKLGSDHPDTLACMHALGASLRVAGQSDRAIPILEEAVEREKVSLASGALGDFVLLNTMNSLAVAYHEAARLEDAVALFEQTFEQSKSKLGPDHELTLGVMANLAPDYVATKRLKESLALGEQALALMKSNPSADDTGPLKVVYELLKAYDGGDHRDETAALAQQVLAFGRLNQMDESELAGLLAVFALKLVRQEQFVVAEACARESLPICRRQFPDHWITFNVMYLLGRSLARQKKFEEAEPLLLGGYQGMKERAEEIPASAKIRVTEALDALVQLYSDWGKPEEREKWQAEREAATMEEQVPSSAAQPPHEPTSDPGGA